MGEGLVFLDIGCGKGFDDDLRIQQSLARESGRYIGIEPDTTIPLGEHIDEAYRCTLEESPLRAGSIDVAFAVMVLEHLADPGQFFTRLWEVLRQGGVFWGFTGDARHLLCLASKCMERFGLKDAYLTWLHGKNADARYVNYRTYYRANTPTRLAAYTKLFSRCDFVSFSHIGGMDFYVPRWVLPLTKVVDALTIGARLPGSLLAVRLEK
jgi:SAM-dependent methyltransferase